MAQTSFPSLRQEQAEESNAPTDPINRRVQVVNMDNKTLRSEEAAMRMHSRSRHGVLVFGSAFPACRRRRGNEGSAASARRAGSVARPRWREDNASPRHRLAAGAASCWERRPPQCGHYRTLALRIAHLRPFAIHWPHFRRHRIHWRGYERLVLTPKPLATACRECP